MAGPAQYPQARFCFWLRERGLLDGVRTAVETEGKDWLSELHNLYVSPVIAKALIAADASFAADVRSARQLLTQQFPPLRTDISTDEFIEAARQALSAPAGRRLTAPPGAQPTLPESAPFHGADSGNGELPHTVLVLDEVQQYINEAQDRSAALTEVAEAVQTQLDSRVMLVGAGQSALSAGTPALLWLRDRFRIAVELTDADVEAVTRKVLLHKRPSAGPEIDRMFEAHAGEVARHLQGTRVAPRPEDAGDRVADYPLLCTRRRFWEACFQAVDAAGSHSQLRSQLRILHDSLANVADRPVGATIPASDLFGALAPSLVSTGVLLNELNTRIQKLDDDSDQGRLRRDLCGLVFLTGKLPRQEGMDLGVRANAGTLADLLIDDITTDSGPRRHEIAGTLEALAVDGVLMKVADEYRLQTTEGAEWDRAFRELRQALTDVEIATRREHLSRKPSRRHSAKSGSCTVRPGCAASSRCTTGPSRPPRTATSSASGCATAGRAAGRRSTTRRGGWGPMTRRCTSIFRREAPTSSAATCSTPRRPGRCSTTTACPLRPRGRRPARAWRAGGRAPPRSGTPSCATCCGPRRFYRGAAPRSSATA